MNSRFPDTRHASSAVRRDGDSVGARATCSRPAGLGLSLRSAAFCLALGLVPAAAQDASRSASEERGESEVVEVLSGDAVVSRFSGFAAEGALDLEGPVVQLLDISSPGRAPDGSVWADAPTTTLTNAGEIGQVFGLAIDAKEPATIYAAASSAFGLHVDTEGNWAWGQWGEGGPGAIYRLSPDKGYAPELFAKITLQDRENTGAALGNIAYDAAHDQLFVSDLESGMIFRLSAETGEVLGHFDHGVDGRSYFLDAELADYAVLDVVAFEPEKGARIKDCKGADGKPAPFAFTPTCWNVADYRRRVWGLGVHADAKTGESRLYYAIWGGAALGAADWADAGEDARNSVWSVGLTAEGDFDIQDIRREVVLPDFVPDATGGAGRKPDPAISDIAFTADGVMLLAERGGLAVAGTIPQFAPLKKGRVLRLYRSENGVWSFDGRYNIGNAERRTDPPYIRANASGGVAVGFGYNDEHFLDLESPSAYLWATGDALCGPDGACFQNDTTVVNGVQGMPIDTASEVLPDAALVAPKDGLSATPPDGVDTAFMIPLTEGLSNASIRETYAGDVEIAIAAKPGEAPQTDAQAPDSVPLDPEIAEGDAGPSVDLVLRKTGPAACAPGSACVFSLDVTNGGPDAYQGALHLYDEVSVAAARLVGAPGGDWQCAQNGTGIYCSHAALDLAPGASTTLTLQFQLPQPMPARALLNCSEIGWLGRTYATRIRFVQQALAVRGYEPGAVDGLYGPQTAAAIEKARKDFGLDVSGEIDTALIEALFGKGADEIGDENPLNDRSCARVTIPGPEVSDHWVALSAFHRKFASARHDQNATVFVDRHEPALSRFHQRYRSTRHDGTTTAPLALHQAPLSRFHQRYRSATHDGVFTRFVPLHTTALSVFHTTASSMLHDRTTTRRVTVHNPALSRFHQRWQSARHDGRVTALKPLHIRKLSQFHLRNRSARHDGTVTQLRPAHGQALSVFHRRVRSGLHDKTRTQLAPNTHSTGLSSLHRRIQSAQHDPWTTGLRPLHKPALSEFHRQRRSSVHNPATTSAGAAHDQVISRLHLQVRSVMHDARTTQRRSDVHAAALSRFHTRFKSSAHVTGRSTIGTAEHASAVSRFHRSMRSSVHNRTTTNVVPSHQRSLSAFHLRTPSAQHRATTSQRVAPQTPQRSEIERKRREQIDKQRQQQSEKARQDRQRRLDQQKKQRQQLLKDQQQRRQQQIQRQQQRQKREAEQKARSTQRLQRFHSRAPSSQHNTATSRRQ